VVQTLPLGTAPYCLRSSPSFWRVPVRPSLRRQKAKGRRPKAPPHRYYAVLNTPAQAIASDSPTARSNGMSFPVLGA
jgi:hypothetical protein